MNKLKHRRVSKKAFTIIELIVVIAVIGILVLLGMPKVMGYVQEAQLTRIRHDTRIMENAMEEEFQYGVEKQWEDWDTNYKNLFNVIARKQLFEIQGVTKKVDMSYMRYHPFILANPGVNPQTVIAAVNGEDVGVDIVGLTEVTKSGINLGGPLVYSGDSKDATTASPHTDYRVIPTKFKHLIGTRLKGTFYVNTLGKVYYEPNKPLKIKDEDNKIKPNCFEDLAGDYTFEHITGTIVKYNGSAQHLVIPASFLVEGQCWPVKIIGKGAFMKGQFKSIVIPSSVEIIDDDAFRENDLTDVMIPPGVTEIGKGAFEDNLIGEGGVIIQRPKDEITIGPGAFDNNGPGRNTPVVPTYKPPTDKELDIIVKPNLDDDGNIIGGTIVSGGGGSGGSNSSGGSGNSGGVIVIPPTIIVGGKEVPVTEIASGAYQGEGLITVVMPEGLERIEDYAFAGNQLIGVNIPLSVNYIGNYAFAFNEVHKVGNIPGPESIATIKTIIIKELEQFSKVNKYGDIYESGKKVDLMPNASKGPDVILKNHIWVTSIGNVVIEEEYVEGMKPGSKKDLTNKVKQAEKLKESDYISGWQELQSAIQAANVIVKDDTATEVEITVAINNVQKAINELVDKPADKSGLVSKLQQANKLKQSDYISGWPELQAAIQAANVINDKEKSTDVEIATAIKNIQTAIDGLVDKPADKSGLISKLAQANKLKQSDYISGWPELQATIQAANVINDKERATDVEIATAIKNIQTAIDGLVDKPSIPGPVPSRPIEGATDGTYTFHGEVSSADLISGNELAIKVFGNNPPGIENKDKNTSESYSTEPWLKFTRKAEDGKITTMFVAKKPLRHSISWDQINAVGAVFGTKTVEISGQKYKVRLMRGALTSPSENNNSDRGARGSEWNRIMLPIHEQAINKSWAYHAYVEEDIKPFTHGLGSGPNGRYTDADLLTHGSYGNGSYSWTQETTKSNTSFRVGRGILGVSDSYWNYQFTAYAYHGWRPVLELVPAS